MQRSRVFFDLTSIARWTGPPVGIIRAQQKLASFARHHRDDVSFTIFDPDRRLWRELSSEWVDTILERSTIVEMSMLREPAGSKHRCLNALPGVIRDAYYWLTKSRRKALFLAEDLRLSAASPLVRERASRAVERLMKQREREYFFDREGRRRNCPPFSRVAGRPVRPGRSDITVAAQFDWAHTDIRAIHRSKQRLGFRHLVLCYDIIPIVHPEWYFAHDVRLFENYYRGALATADAMVVNAHRTAIDLQMFCQQAGIEQPPTTVVPLGADPPKPVDAATHLPETLATNRYALYVSTIEPRKNHALLLRVWKRLLAEGIPQRHQFRLVFVGRPGWKMDEFIPSIRNDATLENTIQILHGIDDRLLARLYHDSAFCMYPSVYEGFGLPAAEALAYGKPLLASSGGSIPEAVGPGVPCLDPHDDEAWYRAMKRWIASPAERQSASRQSTQRPASWEQAAEQFFHVIDGMKDVQDSGRQRRAA